MIERLRLENAVIKYGETTIINDVSLIVNAGEIVFITGANGSGKSTLTKTIAGLLPLSSGKITRAQKISYVPQIEEADKNFPATVWEIVLTGRQRKGKLFYNAQDKEIARQYVNVLEINELVDREIKTLSGGQLQRVFLARALCGEPELLLLDEPCTGLDSDSHKILFAVLRENLSKGCAIIMVTHDDSDLAWIKSSRVIKIEDGKIYE